MYDAHIKVNEFFRGPTLYFQSSGEAPFIGRSGSTGSDTWVKLRVKWVPGSKLRFCTWTIFFYGPFFSMDHFFLYLRGVPPRVPRRTPTPNFTYTPLQTGLESPPGNSSDQAKAGVCRPQGAWVPKQFRRVSVDEKVGKEPARFFLRT